MPGKRTSLKAEEKKSVFQAYKCYATFHPDAVLSGGFEYEQRIVEDFERFRNKQLAPPANRPPKSDRGAVVGFDTEYDKDSQLLTVGVADRSNAAAYEVTDAKGVEAAKKVIKHAKTLVGHSVTGDLDHLVRLGCARESWLAGVDIRDSLLLARMHDENRGKGGYGLEALLLSEYNFTPWKAETEKLIKATGNAADWSPEQRIARCRLDAWATAVLAEHFERKLDESKADSD